MSNMLRGTSIRYFQIPHSSRTEHLERSTTPTAKNLYRFLWSQSERYSKLTLKLSNKAIAEEAWIPESQVGLARKNLVDLRLIQADKVTGGYEYTLCDPESGKPIPNARHKSKGFDFDKMSAEDNKAYFLLRLQDSGVEQYADTVNGLKAPCPLCKGDRPTFEVHLESGRWHCHKCSEKGRHIHFEAALALAAGHPISAKEARRRIVDVLPDIGVTDSTTAKPEAEYAYCDEHGTILFEVVKFPGKRFYMKTIDKAGDPVYKAKNMPPMLYRLPFIMPATTVFICEGEKDADRMHNLKLEDTTGNLIPATTNSNGANKWKPEHTRYLAGKRLILFGDNDDRGVGHMDDVQDAVSKVAASVFRVYVPAPYNDISAFLEMHSVHELLEFLPNELIRKPVSI